MKKYQCFRCFKTYDIKTQHDLRCDLPACPVRKLVKADRRARVAIALVTLAGCGLWVTLLLGVPR